MSPSDQNNFNTFHPVDPHTELSGPGKPAVGVFDHPLTKISECYSIRILAPFLYWNG
jgi:hypothetical protein